MATIRVSQLPILVEIDQVMVRASQVMLLVEIDFEPTIGGTGRGDGTGATTSPSPSPAAPARPGRAPSPGRAVSLRAAALGGQLFAVLAASRASTQSKTTGAGGGGGTMSSTKRTVVTKVEINWTRGTNPADWINESAYVVSVRGGQTLTAPEQLLVGGRGQVGSCSIILSNHTARFSPQNSAGALYATIAAGGAYLAPVKVTATIDGTDYLLFTGVLREMTEAGVNARQAGTVTVECRSRDELLLQDKRSTALGDFLADSTATHTEDYHIIKLLERAGGVDGTDFVSQTYADAHPGTLPTIDLGRFPIRWVWLDDESVLDEIWNLVAACCGWFYCDHSGKYHYHNITAVLPAGLERQYGAITTVALTEEEVAGLQLRWPTGELYNEVAVEIAPREPGEEGEVWRPDSPPVVQPNQTKTIWARLGQPLTIAPTLTWTAYTSGGVAIGSGLAIAQTDYAQRVKLVIANTGTLAAYFNVMALTGQTLSGGRTVEVERVSTAAFWTARQARRRTIRGNVYIQNEAQAETIAAYALKRAELPVLTATVRNHDQPDVRIGWPVEITYLDNVSSGGKITGMVIGVTWNLDKTGFHQDLTVLETGSLFTAYDPIFILGTHKLGADDTAGEAYLFY